jgi:charged multivesicular body protein 1
MGGVVKGLDQVMASMDLEKISGTMDKFERLFGDLDTHTEVMENTMASAMTLTTPEDQVDNLMRQVAEENGLEVLDKMTDAPSNELAAGTLTTEEEDKLSRRLAQLRDPA